MADVFLSYSRADREKAQQIALALEAEAIPVWWDKVLRAGQTYDEVTEAELREAKVVVVLWSQVSVKSKWVRTEATLGERTSTVIPAMIEEAERPIMFELTQTADLIGWNGDTTDERWRAFVGDIQLAIEHSEPAAPAASERATGQESGDATIETTFWTSIKDGSDPADFEAYLKRYPEGHYADLARNRLTSLDEPASKPPTPQSAARDRQAPAREKRGHGRLAFFAAAAALALAAIGAVFGGGFGAGPGLQISIRDGETDSLATFADCADCPELVTLPGGAFMMGSPDDEPGRAGYEGPQREVALSSFAIGRTEVTFSQWDSCVGDGGVSGLRPFRPRLRPRVRGGVRPLLE